MKNKKRKQAITLIEIMIVIVLIGLIGGAIGVNMKNSIAKGKEFKETQSINKIKDILELKLAEGEPGAELKDKWETIVKESPLAGRDPLVDARGKKFIVDYNEAKGEFSVTKAP